MVTTVDVLTCAYQPVPMIAVAHAHLLGVSHYQEMVKHVMVCQVSLMMIQSIHAMVELKRNLIY